MHSSQNDQKETRVSKSHPHLLQLHSTKFNEVAAQLEDKNLALVFSQYSFVNQITEWSSHSPARLGWCTSPHGRIGSLNEMKLLSSGKLQVQYSAETIQTGIML